MTVPRLCLNPKAADKRGTATCFALRSIGTTRKAPNLPDTAHQPLVAANLAATMKVKSPDGKTLGAVHAFMVHKRSGRAMYAVLSLGGFLGIGKAYYAVPIQLLSYDRAGDQYIVGVGLSVLEGGPSWASTAPAFDQDYADRIAGYFATDRPDLEIG